MPKTCPDCIILARALYQCMKATGLSLHPAILDATTGNDAEAAAEEEKEDFSADV